MRPRPRNAARTPTSHTNPGSIVCRMKRTENSSRALKKAWLDPIRRASLSRPRIDLLNQIGLLFARRTIHNILKGPFSAPIVPVGHEKPRRAHRTADRLLYLLAPRWRHYSISRNRMKLNMHGLRTCCCFFWWSPSWVALLMIFGRGAD